MVRIKNISDTSDLDKCESSFFLNKKGKMGKIDISVKKMDNKWKALGHSMGACD